MIITTEDLRKIMYPKLNKLKTNYYKIKAELDNQGIDEISEVSSDDLLDNDKWDYNMPVGKNPKNIPTTKPRPQSSKPVNNSLTNSKSNLHNSRSSLTHTGSQQQLFKSTSSNPNRDSKASLRPGSAVERKDNLLFNSAELPSRPHSGKHTVGTGNLKLSRPPSHKPTQSYKNNRPISAISRNSRFDQYNHSSAVSLTNINERSEFKGSTSPVRFDDHDHKIIDDDLFEIEEIAPDTINDLKKQIDAQKDRNRELKRQINANNEDNAELEVVISTCMNELRDSLNICKVTTNNFSNVDQDTKDYSDNLMTNMEMLNKIAKHVTKNPSIHLLKSEAKFKLADK